MKELNFLAQRGSNRQKSWSGTNLSIFNALSQYYSLIDYPLKSESSIMRAIRKVLNYSDFGISEIRINQQLYNNITGPVFQFAEILSTSNNRPTFIYQDLSVSYLYELKQRNDPQFYYSGFQTIPVETIRKRMEIQDFYYNNASGIFTMGKWLEVYLKSHYPHLSDRIHHVGGGINLDFKAINPSPYKEGNKILFVGRDFERKGGFELLNAFMEARKLRPNLELHIAGPQNNPASMYPNVFYYGDVNREQLHLLMNKCDVFCLPSHFEAYGLVFIEALCFGLPCLGRDCFEMPYFIEEGCTGELLKSDSSEELQLKLTKLLDNSYYRENVYEKRQAYIKEYSWDMVARRISEVIG